MQFPNHVSEEALELYVQQRLAGPEAEVLEEHVLVCASCQERLQEAEVFVRSMRSALEHEPAAHKATFWSRMRGMFDLPTPAWVALAAVIVGLVFFGTREASNLGGTHTPIAVALTAMRGDSPEFKAGGPIDLKLDARGLTVLPSYRLQLVDAGGGKIWESTGALQNDGIRARVPQTLGAGQYYVRVYGSGADPLREYSLRLR